MGACYSRKAGGGNFSYTTVPMASTKLDDNSCIGRPTPYTRNISSSPSLVAKKGIPISNRFDRKNDPKNLKISNALSSIPRFNSNTPTTPQKSEINENVVNAMNNRKDRNENNTLHVANDNCAPTSHSENNVAEITPNLNRSQDSVKNNKISPSSISCPGDMSSQSRNLKMRFSRIPAKFGPTKTPQAVPSFAKSPHAISPLNTPVSSESNLRPSNVNVKTKLVDKQDSKVSVQMSPSVTDSKSQDSIADSGLGNSIYTEKQKQDDADTLKDLDLLESEVFVPAGNINSKPIKLIQENVAKSDEKSGLKCPAYKRNLNGKWSVDPKDNQNVYKSNQGTSLISSNATVSSYASYKGMLSYKKCLFKNIESETSTTAPQNSKTTELAMKSSTKLASIAMKTQKPLDSASKQIMPHGTNKSTLEGIMRQGTLSPDSDEKSEGIGSDTKTPPSEIENREFLIDDEISDQPTLISCSNERMAESPVPSLQQSVTELHALQFSGVKRRNSDLQGNKTVYRERLGSEHRDSLLLSSEMGSSCSSIASDDLMLDYDKKFDLTDCTLTDSCTMSPMRTPSNLESADDQITALGQVNTDERNRKRLLRRASGSVVTSSTGKDEWRLRSVSLPLRPPRPMSVTETDDGSIVLDSSSYRLLSQDLTVVKTLLLRLKSVVQEAETINPFDQGSTKNIFYSSLAHGDFPSNLSTIQSKGKEAKLDGLFLENADLRRQLVLVHQQLEEKDRTIHLLQQQMTKYTNSPCLSYESMQCINAATQTERAKLTSSLSSSAAGSSETLVSVQHAFEEHINQSSMEQENFREQIEEMSRSLSNLNQNLSAAAGCSPSTLKKYSSTEL